MTLAKNKRLDIQVLRAIAVLAVCFDHAGFDFIHKGYAGVDIFFVISGYLIIPSLLNEKLSTGKVNAFRFWTRRIARLVPAQAFVFVVVTIVVFFSFDDSLKQETSEDTFFASVSMLNLKYSLESQDYWANSNPSPYLHLWSLSVEEQFYIFSVLAIIFLGAIGALKKKHLILSLLLLMTCSLGWMLYHLENSFAVNFYSTYSRGWEFILGGLVSFIPMGRMRLSDTLIFATRAILFVTLILFLLIPGDQYSWPNSATILICVLTSLLLVKSGQGNQYKKFPLIHLVKIGDISYGLYLWHWPILVLLPIILGKQLGDPKSSSALFNSVALLLALLFALLSERYIENPFRDGKVSMPRIWKLFILFVLISLSISLILPRASNAALKKFSPEKSQFLEDVRSAENERFRQDCAANFQTRSVSPDWVETCSFGSRGGNFQTVVVIGDSHMHQWLPALEAIGKNHGIRFVAYIKSSCPMGGKLVRHPRLDRDYLECQDWNSSAINSAKSLGNISGIIFGFSHNYPDLDSTSWAEGISQSLGLLNKPELPVVIFGDTPWAMKRLPSCLYVNYEDTSQCDVDLREQGPGGKLFRDVKDLLIQKLPNPVLYFDSRSILCFDNSCPAYDKDQNVLLRDTNHLSVAKAKALAPEVGKSILEFLILVKDN